MLQQLQQSFLDSFTSLDAKFVSRLQGLASLSPQQTLEIYHQGTRGKLLTMLRAVYPVCQRLLGDAVFSTVATDYLRCVPLSSDLMPFAAAFVKFLSEYCHQANCFYVGEVARLEWEIYQLLRGADSPQLDLEALAQVDANRQAEIVFHLPPGAVLIHSKYPLDEIIAANQLDNWAVGLVERPQEDDCFYLLVWRDGFEILVERLDLEQWLVLEQIATGACFGKVCHDLSVHYTTLDISTILPRLVTQGWIASFELPRS